MCVQVRVCVCVVKEELFPFPYCSWSMELGGGKSQQNLLDDDEMVDKKFLLFSTSKNDVT
jgi:hypothetical protein